MIRWILSSLLIFSFVSLSAQAIIELRPVKDSVSVGELVTVQAYARLPKAVPIKGIDVTKLSFPKTLVSAFSEADDQGKYPEPDFALGKKSFNSNFIKNEELNWKEDAKGKKIATFNYQIKFWDPGIYQLNVPEFVFQNAYDTSRVAKRPRVVLNVFPPDGLDENTEDIMPIKTILNEGRTWQDFKWLLYLLLALVLSALAFFFLRRKKKEESIEEEVVVRPAHEVALEKLNLLDGKQLWQQNLIKDYQSELTFIVREYLEKRFGINALESTTTEIKTELRTTDFEQEHEKNLIEILQVADMVKFAKANPPKDLHQRFLNDAVKFVENTKRIAKPLKEEGDEAI